MKERYPECAEELSVVARAWCCGVCGWSASITTERLRALAREFEAEYDVTLPAKYVEAVTDPGYDPRSDAVLALEIGREQRWLCEVASEGYLSVDVIFGLVDTGEGSIFNTSYLCAEWGLPAGLVLLGGDGHFWIALDYRVCSGPPVILIDSDSGDVARLADTFDRFLHALVPYESVWNEDGERIG